MGDPRKIRSKYSGPGHPWRKARIEEEKKLLQEYGLKTKREIWKALSKLKSISSQAKKLIATRGMQGEKEKKQLLMKLQKLGLIKSGAQLDTVLSLTLKDLLERRLQTRLVRKNLAKSMKQARQFITHEHVLINSKKISAPSYLVLLDEDATISFAQSSSLANQEHPERQITINKPIKKTKVSGAQFHKRKGDKK